MNKQHSLWLPTLILLLTTIVLATNCTKVDDDSNTDTTTPIVTTKNISDITQYTAVSGFIITSDGGTPATERGVCWSANPSPTIADNKSSTYIDINNVDIKISGLQPNTEYFVRAFATNSKGIGYGDVISFATKKLIEDGIFTDSRDGNVYKTVVIQSQEWMAENLRYLPSVTGPGTGSISTPYYYVYGFDGNNVDNARATANFTTYGVLYNWPAVMAGSSSSTSSQNRVQGVCPTGWHLPSYEDWTQLAEYLGGGHIAGGKLKETGTNHWNSPNTAATNSTGFTALPGGFRNLDNKFDHIGRFGYWYSSTEYDPVSAWYQSMSYEYAGIGNAGFSKALGFSVRCVRD